MGWLVYLIISVLSGFGMAVFIVEKRKDYPARILRVYLKYYLNKIHRRMPKMLACTVCTSFWTTLVAEVFLNIGTAALDGNTFYWLWPLSGFITLGFTWLIMDLLISLGIIAENINIHNNEK